jgi:NAD(P)H-dependent flavin oxidoreductase YrpB (nitropropane dioxygenase family)
VDIVIAQGGEGGGHTGDVPFSVLIPAVVDAASSLRTKRGNEVCVLAAGGVGDGRSLAASLMYGAQGVWVGTRFVASEEAAAPKMHKQQIVSAKAGETVRTLIYSGRPLRVRNTPYVTEWNETRVQEIRDLTGRGIIPHDHELSKKPERSIEGKMWLMGEVASNINEVLPAKVIVDQMVEGARRSILGGVANINGGGARL